MADFEVQGLLQTAETAASAAAKTKTLKGISIQGSPLMFEAIERLTLATGRCALNVLQMTRTAVHTLLENAENEPCLDEALLKTREILVTLQLDKIRSMSETLFKEATVQPDSVEGIATQTMQRLIAHIKGAALTLFHPAIKQTLHRAALAAAKAKHQVMKSEDPNSTLTIELDSGDLSLYASRLPLVVADLISREFPVAVDQARLSLEDRFRGRETLQARQDPILARSVREAAGAIQRILRGEFYTTTVSK